ncbi:MAG: mechanosensitive ion channel family protein [Sulfurovum sp.]|nr:mechanosensitive ion channel family protein [Sulfurovum sp.]
MKNIDINQSNPVNQIEKHTINVIDGLDMNLDHLVQSALTPIYNAYPFLSNTIMGIPFANLIAAIVIFIFFLVLRRFFTFIIIGSLQKLAKYTTTYYDDKMISALKDPASFAFIVVGLHLFFALIFWETSIIKNILNTLIVFVIFWAIIAIADALRGIFHHTTARFHSDLSREMGDFILKIVKILIAGVGLGAMLQVWGINVTALIASLGLGGLAIALAAKDTASNLFGSFALLADKSVRIGEWIKVGEVEGVVEAIGMRTTKIRSFEKSLITVPNQLVANTPIENFSRRGIRRIKMRIGLTYNTSSTQIQKIVNEIEFMLHNHEEISSKDTLLVNFESFGDSALNIFIYTFTSTANWDKYLNIREDIHFKIMQIVEENHASFAFPSQSVYVESLPNALVIK